MALAESEFLKQIEPYRGELKAHCYRMSGSLHEAEDLTQDSLVKAWKGFDTFAGRSSLKRWLYTVATRTCLDALEAKKSRVLTVGAAGDPAQPPGPPGGDIEWLEPYPDDALPSEETSPEAKYTRSESVALAFLSALQLLPARQRAVLLLRDVLGWQASECAELLEMSVAAVNSALQRARDTITSAPPPKPTDDSSLKAVVEKYVRAWERSDVAALVALLKTDAIAAMPPLSLWLQGAQAVGAFMERFVMPRGKFEMKVTRANGAPALKCYLDGKPSAVHVLTVRDGQIARLDAFLDPRLVELF